jgi:hypothetical protein
MNETPPSMRELHDDYAEQVNLAVAEAREDIIDALAARFAATCAMPPMAGQQERQGPHPPVGVA